MKILFLLNDAPYGNDKNYNALRTAIHLQKQSKDATVFVYLMSDSVMSSLDGQMTKKDNYNIASMLSEIHEGGGEIKVCTSCAEARGLKHLVKGTALGNLTDLANWIVESDRVLTF
jgi:uncharacterized protein involved in oxidation of intracellular sulfur